MRKTINNEPIRILQILPGGHICGGIEQFVMNYYRNIDRSKVQFDFLVHYDEKGYFDDEIKKMGGKIYYINSRKDKNIFKYILFLNKFFKEHKEYKIVHGHMPGFAPIYFFVAKLHGVKIRIAHSHVTATEKTLKGRVLKIISKLIKYFSNIYFACSSEAGEFMFKNREFKIIHNAIDIDKYLFKKNIAQDLKRKYHLEDNFVIGCVGRYNQQKNHQLLIKIFFEILKQNNKARLVLLGEGPLENEIKDQAKQLGILDNILFLGVKTNANEYYNLFDCFVLTSNFEGLSLVLIEAQANGLRTFTTKNVSKESKVSDTIKFISINAEPKRWADEILSSGFKRGSTKKDLIKNGYDLKIEAKKLEKIYIDLYGGH